MKHLKNIFRKFFLLGFILCGQANAYGQTPAQPEYYDSVEVSLLTCSPHEEVYSLYGHTALRYHDFHTGKDVAFNWGMFNFNAPHFVARFIFGLTDYELGVSDFQRFCSYYRRWGSSVTEQVLRLTNTEKLRLTEALAENLRPENRVYRYNFFYDNCATRPRNIVEQAIEGEVQYMPRPDYHPSFRTIIRNQTRNHPWATFGNDILLGLNADKTTNRQEQEFLPQNLLYDFDHAQVRRTNGEVAPLVEARRTAVAAGVQIIESDFPLTPSECSWLLLLLAVLLLVFECRRRRTFKYWDLAIMLLTGLAGCVLFVMVFSQHPCTTLNLQLLLLNPLPLFFIPSVLRRKKNTRYWSLTLVLICLFLIGGLWWQDYAEGTYQLALCLLTRFWSNMRNAETANVRK